MVHRFTRFERLYKLLALNAPLDLIENEIRLLIRERMEDDLKWGPSVWGPAHVAWSLFCLVKQGQGEVRELKKKLAAMKRQAKNKEAAT